MSVIKVLPPDVVELIAAGEVVERPASCIKELVENSLDAGATAISVAIEGGGLDVIRVTDNGGGMAGEDLRLAFLPHATSKLHRAQDLHLVATLGFRGEALASIARVSKITLHTRQKGAQRGMKAVNEGGQMLSIQEAAGAEGTSIVVKDLFFNAPVRRDFMKKPQREAALCAELMQQLILSRPDVAFRFSSDGKQLYSAPGDRTLDGAVLAVYARETGQGMVLPEEAGAPARSAPSAEPGPAADQAPAGGVSPLAAVPDANDSPDSPPDGPADPTPGKRPHLRVVK